MELLMPAEIWHKFRNQRSEISGQKSDLQSLISGLRSLTSDLCLLTSFFIFPYFKNKLITFVIDL